MKIEDYFKYYIQGSDHYLIPKDVFDELFGEMVNWRKEIKELNQKYLNAVADYETTMSELQELKKQLEKVLNDYCRLDAYNRTQQKEFTNYLEDKINYYKRNTQCFSMNLIKEILQKYKSIIGDDK